MNRCATVSQYVTLEITQVPDSLDYFSWRMTSTSSLNLCVERTRRGLIHVAPTAGLAGRAAGPQGPIGPLPPRVRVVVPQRRSTWRLELHSEGYAGAAACGVAWCASKTHSRGPFWDANRDLKDSTSLKGNPLVLFNLYHVFRYITYVTT